MPDPGTPGHAAIFEDRARRWLIRGLVIAVVMGLLGFAALPAYRAFKRHRGHSLAVQGLSELERGEFDRAATTVRLALRFAPQEPKAWRLAGKLLTRRPSPDGIGYWQALIGTEEATREDHREYCQLLLALRRFDLLKKELGELMRRDPNDVEALELTAFLLESEGRLTQAINIARVARETAPDRRSLQLLLGRLLRREESVESVREAAGLIWDLALRPGLERPEAVRLLAGWPVIAPNEADLLARIVAKEFPETIANQLLVVELQRRSGRLPDEESAIAAVRQLVARASTGPDRLLLADWFLAHRAPDAALDAATGEACRSDGILLQRRLQALAVLRQWTEIEAILRDDTAPLGPVARFLFRASFDAAQGRTNDIPAHLQSAAAAAGSDPAAANLVARYAELLGRHDLAADALKGLLANPNLVPSISRRLLDLYRRIDDEGPIIDTLRRLREFTPDNDDMLNELAWMQLIAGIESESSTRAAAQLVERHPDNPRYAATLGLARLRGRNADAALQATDRFEVGPESDLHLRLVRCAALGASGQRAAARQAGTLLDRDRLRPRELDLVRPWLPSEPPPDSPTPAGAALTR